MIDAWAFPTRICSRQVAEKRHTRGSLCPQLSSYRLGPPLVKRLEIGLTEEPGHAPGPQGHYDLISSSILREALRSRVPSGPTRPTQRFGPMRPSFPQRDFRLLFDPLPRVGR